MNPLAKQRSVSLWDLGFLPPKLFSHTPTRFYLARSASSVIQIIFSLISQETWKETFFFFFPFEITIYFFAAFYLFLVYFLAFEEKRLHFHIQASPALAWSCPPHSASSCLADAVPLPARLWALR